MFDSYYTFNKVGVNKAHDQKYLKEIITYSFRSAKKYYLAEVEVYLLNIYVIKFYLKKDKRDPLKYNVLTNENKGSKVISTCIRIMLQIHAADPLATFGFLGSNTINQQTGYAEPKSATKRFMLYRRAMYALFGNKTFTHYIDMQHSAYLMVSNKNISAEFVKNSAKEMFNDIYPELGD